MAQGHTSDCTYDGINNKDGLVHIESVQVDAVQYVACSMLPGQFEADELKPFASAWRSMGD